MTVGEICNREVIIANKTENITDIAKLIRNAHVSSVVMAYQNEESTQSLGIITDRDLLLEVLAQDIGTNSI